MRMVRRVAGLAMLVVGATALTVAAQPPGGGKRGGYGQGGVLSYLTSKTVREEIKVTDEQAEKLKTVGKELVSKVSTFTAEKMKDAGIDRDTPREEMTKKLSEISAEVSTMVYKELGTVLDEKQIARMKQIEVQASGLRAFSQPAIKSTLKITDEQAEKVKAIGDDVQKEMRDLGEEYGVQRGRPPEDADKAKEYAKRTGLVTKKAMTDVLAIMSDEQKAAYKTLTGDPVDVDKIRRESMAGGRARKDD